MNRLSLAASAFALLTTASPAMAAESLDIGVAMSRSEHLFLVKVRDAMLERAKAMAPGYDIYALHDEWRQFALGQGELPRNPDAAFLGFCKKRHERAPLR